MSNRTEGVGIKLLDFFYHSIILINIQVFRDRENLVFKIMKRVLVHNNPIIKPYRKELRFNLTDTEKILWTQLRDHKMGIKFRRQYSIDKFILDFYAPKIKLAIELDGSQHLENQEYDRERTYLLEHYGCTVIRFWNGDILHNLDGVIMKIQDEIRRLQN